MAEKNLVTPIDPVYRIPDTEVDPDFLVQRAIDRTNEFEADRAEWMSRREEYYLKWDDYISPIYKGAWNGAANFHLPMTEIKVNAMHSMIMLSVFGIPIPFYVDPQEDADLARIQKIERKMKYILMRYTNFHKGIYNAIDDWAWDLSSGGIGILSDDWVIQQRRFLTIDKNPEFEKMIYNMDSLLMEDVDEKIFKEASAEFSKKPFQEKMMVRTVFNGPILVAEDPEFILFKGDVVDATDLNQHETVVKVCYMSRNDLLTAHANGFMDEESVENVLSRPPDRPSGSAIRQSGTRQLRDSVTGINTNGAYISDQYEVLIVYDTVNPKRSDKMSLADRLVYYVHPASRSLLRWTYLDRISSTGKIPLHMAHLYRRPRRSTGRGLVETLNNMNEISDILVNQSIDAGMLANNPMGAYRGNSTFDPDEFIAEPGKWMKTDDPNQDLRILNWNINPNWSGPLQAGVQSFSDQIVGLGPTQMGQIGQRVGALRSTSGIREMNLGAEMILNVITRRIDGCLSGVYESLYANCVNRMPKQMDITVVGMDGVPELDENGNPIRETLTAADLRMRVHFGLMANSTNMNRVQRLEDSMKMAQFLLSQVSLSTGTVTPQNIYEIFQEVLRDMGKMRIDRFITKPEGSGILPLEMEVQYIIQGMTPVVVLADPEHQKKIEFYEGLLSSPTAQMEVQYGKVHPQALSILKSVYKKHVDFQKALDSRLQVENPTGSNVSPTLGLNGRPQQSNEDANQVTNMNQNINIEQAQAEGVE